MRPDAGPLGPPGPNRSGPKGTISSRAIFRAQKPAAVQAGEGAVGVALAVELGRQAHDVASLRERRPARQQTLEPHRARKASGGDVLEAVVANDLLLVLHERFDVVVGQEERAYIGQRSAQSDACLRNHRELAQPASHAVEQRRVLRSRATQRSGVSGHRDELVDVVRLRAVTMRRGAEATRGQRAADGDVQARRQYRREIAPGLDVADELAPRRSCLNANRAVPDLADAVEAGQVEQDAAVGQRLPGLGVTRAANGYGAARVTGEVQGPTYVLRRLGRHHPHGATCGPCDRSRCWPPHGLHRFRATRRRYATAQCPQPSSARRRPSRHRPAIQPVRGPGSTRPGEAPRSGGWHPRQAKRPPTIPLQIVECYSA